MPAISSRKPYRIGRSRTGLGLFATKPIKKGTQIVEYFGPLLDSRNEKHDAVENKYLFQINGRWTIDGSVRRNVARYINHACRPNAESDVRERKRKVFIRAIKNIAPGEEINYDYGKEYFNEYLKPIGCKCAACEKKRKLARAEARVAKARAKKRAAARAANGAGHGAVNGAANGAAASRAKPATKRSVRSTAKAATQSRRGVAGTRKRG
ncbi:MAG TPA: SET domain-containing protein [Roseiarcus sp.]|nr:SET domain-containing protein [Roseiarcus sp.]